MYFNKQITTFIIIFLSISNLNGVSLKQTIEDVVRANSEIISEHFNKLSSKNDIKENQLNYYPTIDLQTTVKKENVDERRDTNQLLNPTTNIDGWNAKLTISQILYNGSKRGYDINRAKHKYYNVKDLSDETIEDIILSTVKIYTKLASFQELIAMDRYKIKVHKKYLAMADEKEEISGEVLDSYLVQGKIKAIIDNLLSQEVDQQKAIGEYKKYTTNKLEGNICRPNFDKSLIPNSVEEAIELGLKNSNKIIAQKERIKEQYMKIQSLKSRFKPLVKLDLIAQEDHDLLLEENGDTTKYTLSLQANWNLFNGGKDANIIKKENIAYLEQKKILQTIQDDLKSKIEGSYNTYFKLIKRIENLKEYVQNNKAVVEIYNRQLEDGTKTFLDLLNGESELFRTKLLLINLEYKQIDEYYQLLRYLNILSDSILMGDDQICKKYIFNEEELQLKQEEKTDEQLNDELGLD